MSNTIISKLSRSGTHARSQRQADGRPSRRLTPRRDRSTHSKRSARGLPRRRRRGLIGMLLSIVVAVVIVIAIFGVYNQLTAAANAAQTAVFVRQLVPQITSQYRGDYTGVDAAAAIRSGFVPDNWQSSESTIKDPNGAAVTIGRGGGGRLVITIVGGVPIQTCKAVLGALKSDRSFFGLRSGNNNIRRRGIETQDGINTACATATGGDFKLRFE